MAEYIEREKVYKMLNALGGCGAEPENWSDGWDKAIDTAVAELNQIPAVDVRPERHGRNITDMNPVDEFICSECEFVMRDTSGYDGEEEVKYEFELKFCPKCGAKMDGKDGTSQ